MKKVYTKPGIVFENFSVCTHIAAGCEHLTDLPSEGNCGYKVRTGDVVFVTELTGCTSMYPEGEYAGSNNLICYHVPSEDYNLFASA